MSMANTIYVGPYLQILPSHEINFVTGNKPPSLQPSADLIAPMTMLTYTHSGVWIPNYSIGRDDSFDRITSEIVVEVPNAGLLEEDEMRGRCADDIRRLEAAGYEIYVRWGVVVWWS